MSLIANELREVWDALRANNRSRDDSLSEVRVKRLRGIQDLRVPIEYPVSVLAGPNGCGKSTVLLACACAYRDPNRNPKELAPSSLFPNFTASQQGTLFAASRQGTLSDALDETELEFHYLHGGERLSMVWRRGKSWSRSYMGRKGGSQPQRGVYLRTLANLTNPSEVRSVLQLGRKQFHTETVEPNLLIFAHRILPWRYRNLSVISAKSANDLLFAEIGGVNETSYSEFHMSSGERTILRISKDISHLENALVLIDEVDTGLHPYTQQQAMLELQRSALRRGLQIIVASHSPVVLDAVPPEARIFLDREETTGNVVRMPLYRDIFQKALYGQSRDQLSVLCEDEVAEGLIRGVLDVLNVEMGLRHEDVVIGRNTGRDEFSSHIRTLGKFGKLKDFIFVLDGDSRDHKGRLQAIAEQFGHRVLPLFLPGETPPEPWIWEALQSRPDEYATRLGLSVSDIERTMQEFAQLAGGAVHGRDEAKSALGAFAATLNRTLPDVARIVGQKEAEDGRVDEFMVELREQIGAWRQL